MANFDIAFNRTIIAEGGYVNDPDDKGKETYMGISPIMLTPFELAYFFIFLFLAKSLASRLTIFAINGSCII